MIPKDTLSQKRSLHQKGELSPVKTRVWYRTHKSKLENGLYHADNASTHAFFF